MNAQDWAVQGWAPTLRPWALISAGGSPLCSRPTRRPVLPGPAQRLAQGRGRGRGQTGTCAGTPRCTRPAAPLKPSRGRPPLSHRSPSAEAARFYLRRAGLPVPPPRGVPREREAEGAVAARWPLALPWSDRARRGKDELGEDFAFITAPSPKPKTVPSGRRHSSAYGWNNMDEWMTT